MPNNIRKTAIHLLAKIEIRNSQNLMDFISYFFTIFFNLKRRNFYILNSIFIATAKVNILRTLGYYKTQETYALQKLPP